MAKRQRGRVKGRHTGNFEAGSEVIPVFLRVPKAHKDQLEEWAASDGRAEVIFVRQAIRKMLDAFYKPGGATFAYKTNHRHDVVFRISLEKEMNEQLEQMARDKRIEKNELINNAIRLMIEGKITRETNLNLLT